VSFDYPDLNYPVDIRRKIDRKWQRYSAAPMRVRLANDHKDDGGRCPLCNAPAPITPIASSYRDAALIHHRWRCTPCGHGWITTMPMPS